MAIDLTLTSAQQKLQRNAREFAVDILQPLVKAADEEPDTQQAFRMLKGAYVECYKLGFATGFLPKQYGGGGNNAQRAALIQVNCARSRQTGAESCGRRRNVS